MNYARSTRLVRFVRSCLSGAALLYVIIGLSVGGCGLLPVSEERAHRQLALSAAGGDPVAQHDLGLRYHVGHYVEQDIGKAMDWMTRSASQYHEPAIAWLGKVYFDGDQIDRDFGLAREWLEKLPMTEKNAPSMILLGDIYRLGLGTERNPVKALQIYQIGANAGDAAAQYYLGNFYRSGLAVEQDTDKAEHWYVQSAMQGDARAQHRLAILLHQRARTPAEFTAVADWYRQAAKQDLLQAQYDYAIFVKAYPETTRAADQESLHWLRVAAERGHADAQAQLGELYLYGNTATAPDIDAAVAWLRLAADQDSELAACHLGNLYYQGRGVPQDFKLAAEWFEKATQPKGSGVVSLLGMMRTDCRQTESEPAS